MTQSLHCDYTQSERKTKKQTEIKYKNKKKTDWKLNQRLCSS